MRQDELNKKMAAISKRIKKDKELLLKLKDEEKKIKKLNLAINAFTSAIEKEILKDEHFRNLLLDIFKEKNKTILADKLTQINLEFEEINSNDLNNSDLEQNSKIENL